MAVVDISRPDEIEVLYSGNGVQNDVTFSPDNRSVLFALNADAPHQPDLFLADRGKTGQIKRLRGQPDDYQILGCDWSADGKEIIFVVPIDPTPVNWPFEEEAGPR